MRALASHVLDPGFNPSTTEAKTECPRNTQQSNVCVILIPEKREDMFEERHEGKKVFEEQWLTFAKFDKS